MRYWMCLVLIRYKISDFFSSLLEESAASSPLTSLLFVFTEHDFKTTTPLALGRRSKLFLTKALRKDY
jgi:hypothetical protein